MNIVYKIFFLLGAFLPVAQVLNGQDIEILEESEGSVTKLFAHNTTDAEIDMTFEIELTGFTSDIQGPVKKLLAPKSKVAMMTLTAPSGVECQYKSSVSYNKKRKTTPTVIPATSKDRMTSTVVDPHKINVFTQDGCGRCEFVVSYLTKNGIPFVELNTSVHKPNQELMFSKLEEAGFKQNSVQMPVIINKGKTEFNIKDLPAWVKKINP